MEIVSSSVFIQKLSLEMMFQNQSVYYRSVGPDRFKTNNIVTYTGKHFYKDDKEPSKYNEHCEEMVAALVKSIIIIVPAIIISYTAIGVGVFYALVFEGKRLSPLGIEVPFVDINTDGGYMVTLVLQSFVSVVAFLGTIGIEVGACLAYNTESFYPGLIHMESDELENELKSNGMSLRAEKRIRNIFMLLLDFDG